LTGVGDDGNMFFVSGIGDDGNMFIFSGTGTMAFYFVFCCEFPWNCNIFNVSTIVADYWSNIEIPVTTPNVTVLPCELVQ